MYGIHPTGNDLEPCSPLDQLCKYDFATAKGVLIPSVFPARLPPQSSETAKTMGNCSSADATLSLDIQNSARWSSVVKMMVTSNRFSRRVMAVTVASKRASLLSDILIDILIAGQNVTLQCQAIWLLQDSTGRTSDCGSKRNEPFLPAGWSSVEDHMPYAIITPKNLSHIIHLWW
eukprot:CAMPEP_0170393242 /NCGR_PEP_ID=MMETSP0117_2-20130122/20622_1 /TAXON_ID=400756 /ORGANISM="Durinskia baltica, Strain CSIRO CS-38" /LENGTH=174 /DNA_ID=CAMNT_0010649435 /DNA_START=1050 /DNA_END=1571 /DNA_ORIENTATION=-